jgi:hypothetical protein
MEWSTPGGSSQSNYYDDGHHENHKEEYTGKLIDNNSEFKLTKLDTNANKQLIFGNEISGNKVDPEPILIILALAQLNHIAKTFEVYFYDMCNTFSHNSTMLNNLKNDPKWTTLKNDPTSYLQNLDGLTAHEIKALYNSKKEDVNLMQAAGKGKSDKKKLHILGRERNVITDGRSCLITYQGEKITLKKARELEKQLKRDKKLSKKSKD